MDFKNRSYHFGNQLNATLGQINVRAKALLEEGAGYDLRELLLDYLDERINPETGYWSEVANMAGSNGLFKTIAVYNTYGRLYPACEAAAASESATPLIHGTEIRTSLTAGSPSPRTPRARTSRPTISTQSNTLP